MKIDKDVKGKYNIENTLISINKFNKIICSIYRINFRINQDKLTNKTEKLYIKNKTTHKLSLKS